MGNSKNITDTDSRLLEGLSNISEKVYTDMNIPSQIENTVNMNLITTARVLKHYPSLNKYMVELGDGSKKICTVLMLMGGGLMFLYTPNGDRSYCNVLNEPCIIPRNTLYCFVAPVNNIDEYIFLGFYYPNDFIGFNPSKQGQFKILAFGSLGEYSLRFGVEGMEIVSNGKISKSEIDYDGKDVGDVHYTQEEVDELISKVNEDYYSKDEVDNLINSLMERINILEGD